VSWEALTLGLLVAAMIAATVLAGLLLVLYWLVAAAGA
jgi:hypothetical protein